MLWSALKWRWYLQTTTTHSSSMERMPSCCFVYRYSLVYISYAAGVPRATTYILLTKRSYKMLVSRRNRNCRQSTERTNDARLYIMHYLFSRTKVSPTCGILCITVSPLPLRVSFMDSINYSSTSQSTRRAHRSSQDVVWLIDSRCRPFSPPVWYEYLRLIIIIAYYRIGCSTPPMVHHRLWSNFWGRNLYK